MRRAAALGLGAALAAWQVPSSPLPPSIALGLGLLGVGLGRGSGLGAGLVGAALIALRTATLTPGPTLRGVVAVQGTVVGPATGPRVAVSLTQATPLGEAERAVTGCVEVVWRGIPPTPGAQILAVGEAHDPRRPSLPGAPDPNAAMRAAKVHTAISAWRNEVLDAPPSTSRVVHPLLRAIALGDRSGLDAGQLATMRDTGTSHLLAISGSNVALAAYAGDLLARAVVGATTLRWPAGRLHTLRPLASLTAALAFTALVGWPTSALRACVAVGCVTGARHLGIPLSATGALGLAALGVLLIDPAAVTSASFQLSFSAVLGLVRWGPWLDRQLCSTSIPAWLREGLVATTAATLGTLPVSAWWFQTFPPSGLVANAFAVPWTTFVLTPLAFASLPLPEALATPFVTLGARASDTELWVLARLAWPPWHPAVDGLRAAVWLVGLALTAGHPTRACLLTLVVLWPRAPNVAPGHTVTALDVGQGSATLIESGDGWRGLVDVGPPGAGVGAWLLRSGRTRVDDVFLSHADRDHAGGLVEVLDRVEVGHLWVGDLSLAANALGQAYARGIEIGPLTAGDAIGPIEVLAPQDPLPRGATRNGRGLVLHLPGAAWLPGDREDAPPPPPGGPPSAALVAPHHGSRAGADALSAALPGARWAWFSVGSSNTYGHPADEVQVRAWRGGVPILRTDTHGSLALHLATNGVARLAWRPAGHATWLHADAASGRVE